MATSTTSATTVPAVKKRKAPGLGGKVKTPKVRPKTPTKPKGPFSSGGAGTFAKARPNKGAKRAPGTAAFAPKTTPMTNAFRGGAGPVPGAMARGLKR